MLDRRGGGGCTRPAPVLFLFFFFSVVFFVYERYRHDERPPRSFIRVAEVVGEGGAEEPEGVFAPVILRLVHSRAHDRFVEWKERNCSRSCDRHESRFHKREEII